MKDLIRFYYENDGDVVATIGSANSKGMITCYSRIGQHSEGHEDYFNDLKEARYCDYVKLLKELISLGYKPEVDTTHTTKCWRHPTISEINFGHGAIHYADINISYFIKSDGNLKRWAKINGMRYNR